MKLPGVYQVSDLIAALQKMPADTNCYVRSTESGEVFGLAWLSVEPDALHGQVAVLETDRPEYVTCVAREPGWAWCGRSTAAAFAFVSAEHATANEAQGGRLVTCPACKAALTPQGNGA